MTDRMTARAQAAGVLTLVAIVGALLGVLGDRLLAQQRDAARTVSQPEQPAQPVAPDTAPAVPAAPDPAGDVTPDNGVAPTPTPPAPAPQPEPPQVPLHALPQPLANSPRYAERMATVLDLTREQQEAIDAIVEEERIRIRELTIQIQPQFMAIAQQTRQRVEQVLTPAQRRQFMMMRQARTRETLQQRARDMEQPRMPPMGNRRPMDEPPPMQPRRPPTVQPRMLPPEVRIRARVIQDSLNLPIADSTRFRLRQELRSMIRPR